MGFKALTIEGLHVTFRNVPGSAITRISIGGDDSVAFDPAVEAFVDFRQGKRIWVDLELPIHQVRALRRAVIQHSIERELWFERVSLEASRQQGRCNCEVGREMQPCHLTPRGCV
jgi:hypothetical protein